VIHFEPVVIPDELVQAARHGNQAAMSELWDRCEPMLRESIARTAKKHGLDPAEITQEVALVLVSVLRETVSDTPKETNLPTATLNERFRQRVQNRIREYLRAERRRVNRQISSTESWIETALARRATVAAPSPPGRAVARALERLSPRQRSVIVGLYFKEDSVGSVAGELSISAQAVTALHRRALLVLRDAIETPEPAELRTSPD
jgi:RNA polymerase sigma factor (sigma-70 family)